MNASGIRLHSIAVFLLLLLHCGCKEGSSLPTSTSTNTHAEQQAKAEQQVVMGDSTNLVPKDNLVGTASPKLENIVNKLAREYAGSASHWIESAKALGQGDLADPELAAQLWRQIADRFPDQPDVHTELVRAFRLIGQGSVVLAQLDAKSLSRVEPMELADLYMESGDYPRAAATLKQQGLADELGFQPPVDDFFRAIVKGEQNESARWTHNVQTATTTFAFTDNWESADRISSLLLDRVARIRHIADLRTMNLLVPNDPNIAKALKKSEDLTARFDYSKRNASPKGIDTNQDNQEKADQVVYRKHCSHCHGEAGDGAGSASRFLSPAARSFTREPMRYVSDRDGRASNDDIRKSIIEGLAGASMPAYKNLRPDELDGLVRQMDRFQRKRLQRQFQSVATSGEESAIADWIEERLRPSRPVKNLDWEGGEVLQTELGKSQYVKLGCASCHRQSMQEESRLFNDSMGRTIRTRDFLTEPLRRGKDPQEVFNRIVAGIPGTPHPQLDTDSEDLRPLVGYVLSLSPSTYTATTNHSRRVPAN